MLQRTLSCSFCWRKETEVAKLVAGPRVYICDRCAAEVMRIMSDSDEANASDAPSRQASSRALLQRIRAVWRRWCSPRNDNRCSGHASPVCLPRTMSPWDGQVGWRRSAATGTGLRAGAHEGFA
jgi:hypothetical protein